MLFHLYDVSQFTSYKLFCRYLRFNPTSRVVIIKFQLLHDPSNIINVKVSVCERVSFDRVDSTKSTK